MGDYSPYHFTITNETQETAKIQNVSAGSWSPNLPREIAPFETVSATCTGHGGVKGSFTIHYRSDVNFVCKFNSLVAPPKFTHKRVGTNTYHYAMDPRYPVPRLVGDGVKISFSIDDPQR